MFDPTPEQRAIIEAAKTTNDNLCVIARAGAAKTTTLVLVAEALPETDILCLAFNKKIAEEMKERLPDNCESKTLHSLGFKAWQNFTRKRGHINARKNYQLLKAEIDRLGPEDQQAAYELMSETLDAISAAKTVGWLPESFRGHWRPLVDDEDFYGGLPMEPTDLQQQLIEAVMREGFRLALEQGEIDFDDMIFCPAICSVTWPTPTLTLIDEAQDLSPINHHILKKLVRNRRIIAVGDPCQAIYGFRGALEDSMDRLQSVFDMRPLYLTVSFRCPREVTKNARWRAPDMQWPEWAEDGQVLRLPKWRADQLADGDAIICRNNAPLFSMAIKLIEHDRLPEVAGRDLAKPLEKIMKKIGKDSTPTEAALDSLDQWEAVTVKRARPGAAGQIRDQAQCIRIFLRKTETLGDAKAYLTHILSRSGRIHLMTGHKSKGLEFPNVWFLDQHLIDIKKGQDANIKYVIETRATSRLFYVESEHFEGASE